MVAKVQPALLFVDAAQETLGLSCGVAVIRLSDYEAWLAGAGDGLIETRHRASLDGLSLLLFTGGTTGTPKAACLPYRQTLGNADDTVSAGGLEADCPRRAGRCTGGARARSACAIATKRAASGSAAASA